ncbi:High mobility group B protein 6 [Stylosanthes scabra]|uniref:High mobility group B protein 6 n=1 Tax=Stylosanthes scabra TaxID=79078 RepID=A0ABU6SN55_9FABA|nr:High mobility group B protein 6 [Stylosanthes scabra]
MADTAAEVPTRRSRSKRALKDKNSLANDSATTITTKLSEFTPPISEQVMVKENLDTTTTTTTLSQPKKGRPASKKQSTKQQQSSSSSFEKELLEMQEKLQRLHLEKEKTEELLKAKDEALKLKDQELETRGKEQEKLQTELKKLQKLKEFKPTMNLPSLLKDKEQQDKKDKKKRPSAPYILWCKDQWNEIKKTNPEAEFKEISNMLGAKWKTVSAEEKKPYEDKYNAEKEAYMEVMAKEKREAEALKLLEDDQKQKMAMELLEQYMQFRQETEKETKKKNKNKKEKDPLKPKHPLSAYIIFTNERRAALAAENKSVVEVTKITGEEWKNMTEEMKRPYEEMAKKKKEQYVKEMEAYKQKRDEEAANLMKEEEEHMKLQKQEALQMLKKKEKTENLIKKTKTKQQKKKLERNCDPNRPKRPPSSFLLFSKEARKLLQEERPGINTSTLNALVSLKWKELSEEERQMWNGKASEAMEVYKKELEEYNRTIAAATQE